MQWIVKGIAGKGQRGGERSSRMIFQFQANNNVGRQKIRGQGAAGGLEFIEHELRKKRGRFQRQCRVCQDAVSVEIRVRVCSTHNVKAGAATSIGASCFLNKK